MDKSIAFTNIICESSNISRISCNLGNFQLGQTAVVCRYLGEKYGLVPEKEEDKWHAEMLNAEIHDFLGQGKMKWNYKSSKRKQVVFLHRTNKVVGGCF